MFTIQYDKTLNRVTMKNCDPYRSGHRQYGNRVYRNVSKSSLERLVRWIRGDGRLVSTNGRGWWKVKR